MSHTPIFRAESGERRAEKNAAPRPRPSPLSPLRSQEGFTLAALIVILTIICIVVAYTVPTQWSLVMKRERDRQTIFYMKQYARAILAWQMKHNNTIPTSLEQIQEARKPRIIRGGKWPMPLTGNEEDWILVPPQALVPAGAAGAQQGGLPFPNNNQQQNQRGGNQQRGNQQQQQQTPPPVPGQQQAMKLNKELSPPDYKGPFVAVRPKFEGESFIELNGATDYSEWVYTVDDLRNEIARRQQALMAR